MRSAEWAGSASGLGRSAQPPCLPITLFDQGLDGAGDPDLGLQLELHTSLPAICGFVGQERETLTAKLPHGLGLGKCHWCFLVFLMVERGDPRSVQRDTAVGCRGRSGLLLLREDGMSDGVRTCDGRLKDSAADRY
jgi:hypothetical protein